MLNFCHVHGQNYFRKYIDSEYHFDEFNGQIFISGDSIFLLNSVTSQSIGYPFSSLIQLNLKGEIINSFILDSIRINYNSGNLHNSDLFIAGTNNNTNPDTKLVLLKNNIKTEDDSSLTFDLLDTNKPINLVPIGSILFDSTQIVYGQFKNESEATTHGFILWLNDYFVPDSIIIFDNNADWSIISDAGIDNQGKLVILLETVEIIQNIEHHQRIVQKYDGTKQKIFEWKSDIFYSDQGLANISIQSSGIVVVEYVLSIIALDTFGTVLWNWDFPLGDPNSVFQISDILTTENDEIICAGTYRNLNKGVLITGYLLKLNSVGEFIWERIFVDNSEYSIPEIKLGKVIEFQSVYELPSRGIVIGGKIVNSFLEEDENTDIFFAIVDSNGCINNNCNVFQDISSTSEFLDSSNIWTEGYAIDYFEQAWSLKYTMSSIPTLLAGQQYYELLKTNSEFSNVWDPTGNFIRSENNITYIHRPQGEVELYNFNLIVADTFNVFIDGNGSYKQLIVEDIDTIVLLNGEQKKLWKLRRSEDINPPSDYEYTFWIEGIGNIDGLFANQTLWSVDLGKSSILCIYRDSSLIYDDSDIEGCWILTTKTTELLNNNILITPNPSTDNIIISGDYDQIEKVYIYNSIGILVFDGIDSNINISEFSSGYYIIVIEFSNHQNSSKSFIKS
jgi:hypothetical protein